MLPTGEMIEEKPNDFCWISKKAISCEGWQLYESFKLNGVVYNLYDSVFVWNLGEPEPCVGKIVRMWETLTRENRVKLVWYFQPPQIKNYLGDSDLLWNEIFLGCGEGKGLFIHCCPTVIAGKCKVICMSEDERNFRVPYDEQRMDYYFFNRTFNVETRKISEEFPEEIAGVDVEHYFNKREWNLKAANLIRKKKEAIKRPKGVTTIGISSEDDSLGNDIKIKEACLGKRTSFGIQNNVDNSYMLPLKKRKVLFDTVAKDSRPSSGWRSTEKGEKHTKLFEVTRRPEKETHIWFRQQTPWEVKMQRAHERSTLVLLENLDPSYTSSEIEDIVWSALSEKVDAKMIQQCLHHNPHSGKALVIFSSKDAAYDTIFLLSKRCLVISDGLTDGRPIVASRKLPENLNEKIEFYGHLTLDKIIYRKQYEEMKTAVSTSHCSQPNTIEYEMALKWRFLQEQSSLVWNARNKQHGKEIEELESKVKAHHEDQGLSSSSITRNHC